METNDLGFVASLMFVLVPTVFLLVLTKPQTGLGDAEQKIAQAKAEPLPAGPTAWPVDESLIEDEEGETTTSDEEA